MSAPLTLGTAGHIDHGKTALVEALTGRNTDRLPEERARGISIELGFAELELPGGRRLSVVDVPGHERFVRTMVAGATGIDLFLMVIAADDGVMPQTREHLAVLSALGVADGVVALSKCDLVEADARELAAEEAGELLPGAPLVQVSARTGEGLDELRAALAETAARLPGRAVFDDSAGPAVLHVDRSFSLKGMGTVVTGTLWSGSFAAGDRVEVLPAGIEARLRRVQVHDTDVARARAGQRVALNLTGVERRQVARGDVIATAGSGLGASYRLDAAISIEPGAARPGSGTRLQVHHGTREAPGRLVWLEPGGELAQLRLERPLVARRGDRLVIRRIAPPDTIGGGEVIDPESRRHGPGPAVERLRRIRAGGPEEIPAPAPEPVELAAGAEPPPLDAYALHALELLEADGAEPRAPQAIADALGVDRAEALRLLDSLASAGRAVRVKPGIYYAADSLATLRERIVELASVRGAVTLAQVRDELETSRKYAQALLEHLDATRVTIRRGDEHVMRGTPPRAEARGSRGPE